MALLTLAVKDIVRRKGKNLFVAIAVVIPVAILCTILLTMDNANTSLAHIASKFGFTLTIQPKNIMVKKINQIGIILDGYFSESVVDSALDIIKKGINNDREQIIYAPRLYIQTDLQFEGTFFSSIVAGIDYQAELEARPSWGIIPSQWRKGDNFVVLGGTLAAARNLFPGNTVIINNSSFEVAGVMENYNSAEDYMAFLPFGVAQDLFDKRGLVSVLNIQNVSLDRDNEALREVLTEINNSIPNIRAITPQQFSAIKFVMLKKTFKFLFSIIIATVAVSIFSIFNIITSVLYSRVKEIGLYKIAGASRAQILKIFL
jgi:putative ABC transport system permease protein